MATSCKLWIVKLAHREESFYPILFKKISNKNYVGLLKGNINANPNFCPSCLISKNSVPFARKQASACGDTELIPGPAETVEISIELTYGRRFMPVFVQNLFFICFAYY